MTFAAKQEPIKWTEKNIAGALATQANGFSQIPVCGSELLMDW
jgi:hypothetical protein